MTHEHLLIDFQCVLEEPTEASQHKLMEELESSPRKLAAKRSGETCKQLILGWI